MPTISIDGSVAARRYSATAASNATPNLLSFRPVEMYGWVFGVDVRIHAEAHRRPHADGVRDGGEAVELGRRFDVEAVDAGRKRRAHLGFGLADAREHDVRRITAGGDHARELAARHDVEAASHPREHVQHGEVRVGLQRVEDPMRQAFERAVERAEVRLERRSRIDVAGRSEALGDPRERHALGEKLAVDVAERAHSFGGRPAPWRRSLAASGSGFFAGVSGPLMPHAVVAIATTSAAASARRLLRE